jgi:hypothetical protein
MSVALKCTECGVEYEVVGELMENPLTKDQFYMAKCACEGLTRIPAGQALRAPAKPAKKD